MANIEFGETPDQQLAVLMSVVNGLNLTIHGNGHPGLKARAERFMSEYEGAMKQQERQHEENTEKLQRSNTKQNWLLVIGTLILAITGIVGLIITIELRTRANLDPANIFHSTLSDPVLSLGQAPQDAKIPPLTR